VRDVDVFVSGRRAGRLHRSDVDGDTLLFGYDHGSRAEDAVSLTMPVVADQYDSMGTVHPIFEMNLPEGALLEKLRLMFAKMIPDFDDLALLSIVGRSQIGRLRYAAPGAEPTDVPPQSIDEILSYSGAHDLFQDLLQRYAVHSGISGMQPKILLRATEVPDRVTSRGATHIVKSFDQRERPELAANEYYCMRAAHLAGIPAANVTLSANRRILVVERFDLSADGTYLGLEDFCVLNGLRSHGRYEGSYELVAKRIGQFASPDRRRESQRQFFTSLSLSCAVENGDAHLKNFSMIYENPEGAVRLAPAYDIVSTTAYQPRDVLALTLNGSKSFPGRAALMAFGRMACGLTAKEVATALDDVSRGVTAAIAEIGKAARTTKNFAATAEKLTTIFVRGLNRLAPAKQ
jgi:serine/threonine-protein kinase HipA